MGGWMGGWVGGWVIELCVGSLCKLFFTVNRRGWGCSGDVLACCPLCTFLSRDSLLRPADRSVLCL